MSGYSEHKHDLCGYTDFHCNHCHKIEDAETKKPEFIGGGCDHVHRIKGETTKDDGHRHKYCYYTSPAMPDASRCGHYHYFYGVTSYDDGHTHYYRGVTDIEPDYD